MSGNVHFILTSSELVYPYYLSIVSALKTQKADRFILWSFDEPAGKYWPLLKDRVEYKRVEKRAFPALEGKPEHFWFAHQKDRIQYQVLYEHGGLFMDLDTFSVQDAMELLDGSCEVVAPLATPTQDGFDYPFNMCVVLAKKGSSIIQEMLFTAERVLKQPDMLWGDTGPKLFSLVVNANIDNVKVVDKGILGGFGETAWGIKNIFEHGNSLPVGVRIIHLFGKGNSGSFEAINEEYLSSSDSLYARTVRQVLPTSEWNPFAEPNRWKTIPEPVILHKDPIVGPHILNEPSQKLTISTSIRHKRFHLLSLPHVAANRKELCCAFSQKVVKMGKMLKSMGHTVYFYGVEGSEVECDEFIQVSTRAIIDESYGVYDTSKEEYRHKVDSNATKVFNENCIKEIRKRMQSNDFLLIPFSPGVYKHLIDALWTDEINSNDKLKLIVEMGIGYRGTYCLYKVFESVSQMHFNYGLMNAANCGSKVNGHHYDAVIPNYFDPADFTYSEDKEDYILFLGRVIVRKGIFEAIHATREAGIKLIVAGQDGGQGINLDHPHVEYVGFADYEKRRELLSKAKALILPTQYIEPFGGVIIEAAFSGTPVITSNHGAFPELVKQGETGFKCQTLDHYVKAIELVGKIQPKVCYDYAMKNFSLDRVKLMYEEYWDMLLDVKENVNGKGWSRIHPERTNLDWLVKY